MSLRYGIEQLRREVGRRSDFGVVIVPHDSPLPTRYWFASIPGREAWTAVSVECPNPTFAAEVLRLVAARGLHGDIRLLICMSSEWPTAVSVTPEPGESPEQVAARVPPL